MKRILRTLVCILLCAAAILSASGCHKRGILSKNKVAHIMGDLYVCDQYAKSYAEVNLAADSILLYQHIFEKYNTTLEEYQRSLSYYLPDKKAYSAILEKAVNYTKGEANRLRNEKVKPGLRIKIPFQASVAEEVNKWWDRKLDGAGIERRSFHESVKEIWLNVQKEQMRLKELKKKEEKMTPEQRAEKRRIEERAAQVRERFRKDMQDDGSVNINKDIPVE